jgi:hypothetical protein
MSGMHDGENRHRGAMLGGRCGGQHEVGRQLRGACAELRYYYCMTDSNVVSFPKDQRDTKWWESTPVLVRWDVRREPNVPVITAVGTILVERDEPLDDGATDDDYHEKAGEIHIAKAFVDTTDIVLAMDGLTSDHEFLASQIIDGMFYEQEFADWFDDEFGVMLSGDPVFVLDLVVDEKHRDPDCLVAAHAALDALSTFGGTASPLVTFHLEGVDPTLRSGLRDVGLWGWVHALRAKRWKDAYVTSRP